MTNAREDRQIAHASFWYIDADGIERLALRGDSVSLGAGDLERGEKAGAFVADGSKEEADLAYDPKTATIEEVLAYVGEDESRASDALEYETAKGDKARSSLVAKLDAILGNEDED